MKSVHTLVEELIKLTERNCQVVSFGAGSDTLFWLLHAKSLCPSLFVEVDFAGVTTRKCQYIK